MSKIKEVPNMRLAMYIDLYPENDGEAFDKCSNKRVKVEIGDDVDTLFCRSGECTVRRHRLFSLFGCKRYLG